MDVQKEISLRNAISYCIENNDVNTATNRIMEFIRDEKEAINFIQRCTQLPTLLENTNRVEVIDQKGRTYVNWKPTNKVELSLQDDKKTLKVFING